jgi:hypothetical protein
MLPRTASFTVFPALTNRSPSPRWNNCSGETWEPAQPICRFLVRKMLRQCARSLNASLPRFRGYSNVRAGQRGIHGRTKPDVTFGCRRPRVQQARHSTITGNVRPRLTTQNDAPPPVTCEMAISC